LIRAKSKRRTEAEIGALKPQIIASLAAGMTQRQVAKEYNVPSGTVATLAAGAKAVVIVKEKRDEIGEQVAAYIATTLDTLRTQSLYFGERPFLDDPKKTGNASQLAILHGVLADKLVRILGALRRTPDDESAPVP